MKSFLLTIAAIFVSGSFATACDSDQVLRLWDKTNKFVIAKIDCRNGDVFYKNNNFTLFNVVDLNSPSKTLCVDHTCNQIRSVEHAQLEFQYLPFMGNTIYQVIDNVTIPAK